MAVIVVVLASSEGWLKRLVSEWFDACTIVIETLASESLEESESKIVPVNLYVQGKTPAAITLSFRAEKAILQDILFLRDATQEHLAMHPLSGISCPKSDDLCGDMVPTGPTPPKMTIGLYLTNFAHSFDYRFRVTTTPGAAQEDVEKLQVFVLYPKDVLESSIGQLCRVENAGFSNLLSRSDATMRFVWAAIAVFVLTIIVMFLNQWRKHD